MVEPLFWARQRENHTLLRLIDSKVDRVLSILQSPASPTSSLHPTATPTTAPTPGIVQSFLQRIGGKLMDYLKREALSWVLWGIVRIVVWVSSLPVGWLAWTKVLRPYLESAMRFIW